MIKPLKILTLLVSMPIALLAQNTLKQEFSLHSCINYAIANNQNLQASEKNISIAEKDVAKSKSSYYPTVDLNGRATITDMYEAIDEYSNSNISLDMVQPIWQNGQIQIQTRIAKTNKQISTVQFQIEKQNLVYSVSSEYMNYIRYAELESLSSEMANRIAVNVESAKERMSLGVAKKSDVLRAETRLSDAKIVEERFRTLKQITGENLKQLMGLSSPIQIQCTDNLANINKTYLNYSTDSLIAFATSELPELKIIKYNQQKQGFTIKYEQRNNLPELGLVAGYNLNDNPVLNNNSYGYAGISFNLNLFGGLEKKNRVDKEKIRLNQLTDEFNEAQLFAISEIRQAHFYLIEANSQINNSLKQVESAGENRAMAKEEYRLGISSMLELLDAENDYFKAQQNYINAVWIYRQAEITLERKSGIFKY